MPILTDIRDQVYTRINTDKTASNYTFNNFTLKKAWIPTAKLRDMDTDHPGGIVYVIGLASDDDTIKSRNNLTTKEVPVHVGYQKRIPDINDVSAIDTLVSFVEELQETCRKDVELDGYSWNRNEVLKDENEIPFSFVGMRDVGFFEAYFTAYYIYPLE